MIHDFRGRSLVCLISGSPVTVSMETDVTQEAFKLIGFEINTRKRELFAYIQICGVSNDSEKIYIKKAEY